MSKQSGLGDRFFVGGYNLSGDINSPALSGGPATLDVTGVDKAAFERIGGVRDGSMTFTAFFNPGIEANAAHAVLSVLPTADVQLLYCRGATLGAPAAGLVAKQIGYDGTRGQDGSFTFAVQGQGNAYGLEWGTLLTAGERTDTAATNGTSVDNGAATSFGAQAYLAVTGFTGTDVTVTIQDSADNATFADVTGLTFTTVTAAPAVERLQTGRTATLRRYVRAVTTTSGGFTSATFVVAVNVNAVDTEF